MQRIDDVRDLRRQLEKVVHVAHPASGASIEQRALASGLLAGVSLRLLDEVDRLQRNARRAKAMRARRGWK